MGHQGSTHDEHLQFATTTESGLSILSGDQGLKVTVDQFEIFFIGLPPSGRCPYSEIFFDGQIFKGLTTLQDLNNSKAGNGLRR